MTDRKISFPFPGIFTLLLAALLVTSGCGPRLAAEADEAWSWMPKPAPLPEPKPRQVIIPDNTGELLNHYIGRLASDLTTGLEQGEPGRTPIRDGLLICTFTELRRLNRTSSLGRYLAEELMHAFQSRSFTVVEMRKTENIIIAESHGEFGLSRNLGDIQEQFAADAMLTGTYTVLENEVLVNARIVDHRSATLLSSATVSIPRNRVTDTLLADAAGFSRRRGDEVVYMKELTR